MTPKFQFILKNEKLKTYTVISWLVVAFNFVAFVYLGVSHYPAPQNLPYYAAGLLVVIFVFQFISKSETTENDCLNLSFSLIIIAWLVLKLYWAAVAIFILFLMEDISRRRLILLFFDDRIVYPSFPKRIFEWKDISNVILKDGILTIDLKNNKVYQNEITSPSSEIDFNEYCIEKVESLKK